MKILVCLLILFCACLIPLISKEQSCNNWLKTSGIDPGVQIGDLDISGNTVTVEALFNRTENYNHAFYGGDIVSKHTDPTDVNYLLRPTRAEITTTTGWHGTPDVCEFQLNKTYYVALVYDGKTLKFYRNGFLMSQTPCTGNMILNNWTTTIGSTAGPLDMNPSEFHGYINEVRIWKVARTQTELRTYMNKPLPNPTTQNGLLAYYTFNDLKNKQGDARWDGKLYNNASINQTNPECNFIADSCGAQRCNLSAGFTYKQNTCNPTTIQFKDTTANADSIWWNFGDGKTAGNIQNITHQYASFGNYTVQLFAKTNESCLDTASININLNVVKDSAIINRDTAICKGSSVQLNAIKSLSYCWSPSIGLSDSTIQNPIATPKFSTKYYLHIVTGNNQPVKIDSVTINIITPPAVDAGNDVSICKNTSVQLNASGAVKYNWNASGFLSDTTIANPLASPQNTTSFIVKGYDNNGCGNTDTVKVSVLALPVITLANDTGICKGGSVTLQATKSNYQTYNWSPPDDLSSATSNNTIASPADTTKYFVTVTDNNNCKNTGSITVNVLPKPQVTAMSDTSICRDDSVKLKTTTTYASTFEWQPKMGLDNSYAQNPNASPTSSTTYTITAGNGVCSEKASVLISILPLPEVIASNDTAVCGNASVQLNSSGAVSYTWFPDIGLSNPSISDPVAAPGATTTYYVKGTAINSCTNIDSVIVNVNPPPTFNIEPLNTTLCFGDSVLLTATGGDLYTWLPAETVDNASAASTKAHPLQNTTYQVTITNSICKVTKSLTSNVVVKNLPVVTIDKSNDVDCINFEAELSATGGRSYRWSPPDYISNIYVSNPKVYPPVDTKYFVGVKDENGCVNKDSIIIKSTNANAGDAKFEIPNAFTPNHDGINDCFGVYYWGTADVFNISIYNRWGQLVFYSKDLNSGWDGNYKGVPQAADTYVYIINISSRCTNGIVQKKGTVILIR